jgi:hypothetical protein
VRGKRLTILCHSRIDLDWRITWVGSAKNEQYDQILDEVSHLSISPPQTTPPLFANFFAQKYDENAFTT